MNVSQYFFNYDDANVEQQIDHEIRRILMQMKRTMFYNRSEGADIKENYPNTFSSQVKFRYSLVLAVAEYNLNVSNGEGGTVDRRIAISQNSVDFEQNGQELVISVGYYLLKNMEFREIKESI